MTSQEQALVDMARFLNGLQVPYMVIGATAQAVWGIARSTVDIDVTVWVEEDGLKSFIEEVSRRFKVVPSEPLEFIKETRVLPVRTAAGVGVDIVFGMLPFELEALERAVEREVSGENVKFCTAEDLILHKIISEREQDILDVRQLIETRRDKLDREYLDPRVKELADLLERPAILDTYRQALKAQELPPQ
jgi:hypothetical protein